MFEYVAYKDWTIPVEEVEEFGTKWTPLVKELLEVTLTQFIPGWKQLGGIEVEAEGTSDLDIYVTGLGFGLRLCVGEVKTIVSGKQFPGFEVYGIAESDGGGWHPPEAEDYEISQHRSPYEAVGALVKASLSNDINLFVSNVLLVNEIKENNEELY